MDHSGFLLFISLQLPFQTMRQLAPFTQLQLVSGIAMLHAPYWDVFLLGSALQARPCRDLPCLTLPNGSRLNCLMRGGEVRLHFFVCFSLGFLGANIVVNPQNVSGAGGSKLVWNIQQIYLILSPVLHGLGFHLRNSFQNFRRITLLPLLPPPWSLMAAASIFFY